MDRRRLLTVVVLGSTQTIAWASTYYLPAVLADAIGRDTGVPIDWLFGIFSGALVISALLGPRMGRMIDAGGGNRVLAGSNLVLALGLVLLASAQGMWMMIAAWLAMGVGMGFGLYDAAFAVLGRIYGTGARGAITGITLIAGFASTVGWPLSAWGTAEIGWRGTCLAWAALHVVVCLPLNLWLLPRPTVTAEDRKVTDRPVPIDRTMVVLGFAFAAAWIVTAAMAAHFPRILVAAGASPAQAIAAGALIGPAQVGARLLEAGLLARFHPLMSARLATCTHPLGAAVILAAGGGVAAGAFAVLHGSGNGILTIARGTVPLALFGPENYGYRLGILGLPSRFLSALAPLGFAFLIDAMGGRVLLVSAALSLSACAALFLVRQPVPAVASHDG